MLIWQRITCKGTHQDIVQDCNPDKLHRVQLPAYCFWEVWKAHNFHQNFEWQPLCPSLIALYFLKIEINCVVCTHVGCSRDLSQITLALFCRWPIHPSPGSWARLSLFVPVWPCWLQGWVNFIFCTRAQISSLNNFVVGSDTFGHPFILKIL